ncbi:unnamed protein product [Ceutorhynchus assimilis]|uniref:Uncharacterized protein n=1 Tax=Ceutorhynchus assimilis TaxID=467358 RepID=A0A9N9MS26_9CUCU|nr:unnamed protein product [Ceutorhynchus assimilis]
METKQGQQPSSSPNNIGKISGTCCQTRKLKIAPKQFQIYAKKCKRSQAPLTCVMSRQAVPSTNVEAHLHVNLALMPIRNPENDKVILMIGMGIISI